MGLTGFDKLGRLGRFGNKWSGQAFFLSSANWRVFGNFVVDLEGWGSDASKTTLNPRGFGAQKMRNKREGRCWGVVGSGMPLGVGVVGEGGGSGPASLVLCGGGPKFALLVEQGRVGGFGVGEMSGPGVVGAKWKISLAVHPELDHPN